MAAERICASIADEPFMVNGKRIPLTASLGVTSHIPTSPEYVTQLVRTADQALYNAKDNGRNRVESLLDEPDTRKRSRVND
jgi:two-component system, cell cycle response regulator